MTGPICDSRDAEMKVLPQITWPLSKVQPWAESSEPLDDAEWICQNLPKVQGLTGFMPPPPPRGWVVGAS